MYYIDANVAALLCNKEEAKLRKGVAYHYDFALLSILLFFCSIFGLPFATPSLPHSPQYVRALSEIEEITKNGVTRTKVVTVHEQRLSPLLVNVLVLLSFVLLSLLKEIPMAVLYGLFVLMGINGFYENQFFHRLTMIFMEPRLHPPTSYVRNVPLSRVHGFTFVQVCCVAVIWGVRSTDLCLMFPILIAMLMPLRLLLSKFDGMFTKQQLQLLDVNDEAYLVLDDDDDDSNNNDDDDDDDDDRDDDDGDAFDVNDPGFNNNATDDERRQLVRAAQKAAFDSRAMTLMDFAENGPSLNASSLGSARKPQSSPFGTAATPNRYVFPYHSDSKPIKIAQRRTSSYFSDDDLSPRDKSATVSPRRDRPLSPKPSNDNNKNNKSSNSKEEPGLRCSSIDRIQLGKKKTFIQMMFYRIVARVFTIYYLRNCTSSHSFIHSFIQILLYSCVHLFMCVCVFNRPFFFTKIIILQKIRLSFASPRTVRRFASLSFSGAKTQPIYLSPLSAPLSPLS